MITDKRTSSASGVDHIERAVATIVRPLTDEFSHCSRGVAREAHEREFVMDPALTRLHLSNVDHVLPSNDFLMHLHREKRCCERTAAPLSLVLYRVVESNAKDRANTDLLLECLHATKRETDILGHAGNDFIAVLCPNTDERGVKIFMNKIDAHANGVPLEAVTATYPDQLFNSLESGQRSAQAMQPFLMTTESGMTHPAYPLKRWLDVAGALLALAVFGPLMLVVAAAIALESPGPVIYKQIRVGKRGVPFTFYKFRSMRASVNDGLHRDFVASLIKGGMATDTTRPSLYKLESDPRITRIGKWIRKTSIDELPQFFNVLKGDMSIVGPRPPIPYETVHYQPWHLRRILEVQPGITGLWQVEGRSKVGFNEMVRMDLRYIRESSLLLDLRIVLKTVLVVLRCEGAA